MILDDWLIKFMLIFSYLFFKIAQRMAIIFRYNFILFWARSSIRESIKNRLNKHINLKSYGSAFEMSAKSESDFKPKASEGFQSRWRSREGERGSEKILRIISHTIDHKKGRKYFCNKTLPFFESRRIRYSISWQKQILLFYSVCMLLFCFVLLLI